MGIVKLNGIISFHMLFQCKRYAGSVGAGEIRDDASNEKHAYSGNSYAYKACPESVSKVEEQIREDEKNVPQYSLYNSGARNCCGWSCEIVEGAGFVAPFIPRYSSSGSSSSRA